MEYITNKMMKYKLSQLTMVWFLPIIVIGGLFFPLLGYVVAVMMIFLLTLSFFKKRYWCWNLCPRGAFLDIVMPRFSLKKSPPKIFLKMWFRWAVFILFMTFLVIRIMHSGTSLIAIGAIFVSMCLLTTVVAIILGVFTKARGWCAICPMGTLQEHIGKIKKKNISKTADQ